MRKLLLTLAVVSLLISASALAGEFEPQKFKTTFTVVYNEITLERAAELERVFKDQFSDSCSIKLSLDVLQQQYSNGFSFIGGGPVSVILDNAQ